MAIWYAKVSGDLAYLPSCIEYFETELLSAKKEVKIHGNLEKAAAALPGIVEHRFNQLQEIEGILEFLNIELRKIKGRTFKKFHHNYALTLSSRDAEKYADAEDEVIDMEKIINEFALLRNQWLGVIKAIDQKQWQITNIVKLRTAGLEDGSL